MYFIYLPNNYYHIIDICINEFSLRYYAENILVRYKKY